MDTVSNGHQKRSEDRADRLFETADRQAGYDYRLQHYHRERGNWIPAGHGLYRLRQYPTVKDEELARLSLWSRNRSGKPQSVMSHETALRLHDLTDLTPGHTHLSVPKGFRKQAPEGVVLHKVKLGEGDVEERGGYQITAPLRTILDIARSPRVSPEHLEAAVVEALDRGLVRRKRLFTALDALEDQRRRSVVERAMSGTARQ